MVAIRGHLKSSLEKESSMAQTTFNFDEATEKAFEDLKVVFGVKTKAEVLRRLVALGRLSGQLADDNNNLTIKTDHKEVVVPLQF